MHELDAVFHAGADPDAAASVSAGVYYGAETGKALANFQISGARLGDFPAFVHALAYVKLAAARANARVGLLGAEKAAVIGKVCLEILADQHLAQFPLDMFQGGAGTSTNMNVNEVIANRGLEIMGLARGAYASLHPNDDVNCSQSTNDVYPTAVRLAILLTLPRLEAALAGLADAFEERAERFAAIVKLGRTQLQDAVPLTLGQEFMAFAAAVRQGRTALREVASACARINLGGTAIGTGINASREYQASVLDELRRATGISFVSADNLVQASWDVDALVLCSGTLKRIATTLSKICNDLRLLASGPRGGLSEISLPPLQAGSSIMPGKVNPVVPEVVNQVAFRVIGSDMAVTLAAEGGQLQLNVMEPLIVFSLLESMALLSNAVTTLTVKCVADIAADAQNCARHLERSMAGATALTPCVGYERAARLAKEALASGSTLSEVVSAQPDLPQDVIRQILDLRRLTEAVRLEDGSKARYSTMK